LSKWNFESKPLAQLDGFQNEALARVSRQLDDFLPIALMEAHTQLQRLSSPALRLEITRNAVDLFIKDFTFIEDILLENGSELQLQEIFYRTVEDVKILLS